MTGGPNLAANWMLVRHTANALSDGNESLGNVPGLLRRLLEEDAWRRFGLPSGEEVVHERFESFVSAAMPRGLEVKMDVVDRVAGTGDPELLVMLRAAKAGRRGRPAKEAIPTESVVNSTGKSPYIADRLAREHPVEYEAVRAGRVSLNAAAVRAGIRPRRVSVRLDNPESIVNTLQTADPELLRAVRDEISRRLAGEPEP